MSRAIPRAAALVVVLSWGASLPAQGVPIAPPPPVPPPEIGLSGPPRPPAERSRATPPRPGMGPREERRYVLRNPGGVGRFAAYYPRDGRFQNEGRGAPPIPSFGEYPPVTSRWAQLGSDQLGVARAGVLFSHVDAYGRPIPFVWFPGLWWGWGRR